MGWFDRVLGWLRGRQTSHDPQPRTIVIISDMHLGEEIGEGDAPYVEYIAATNRELSGFIEHLRESKKSPITLVINGDSLDFLRTIVQPNPIEARLMQARPLTPREARVGLDSSRSHAVWKLGRVVGYHRPIFSALANFVADGHHLVFIRGNHDVELYWPEVREAIVETLQDMAGPEAEDLGERIQFEPWFYYVPKLLYVEHGHQYDSHCSYEDLLDPVEDEGRFLALPYTQWAVRYFAPLLHGMHAAEMEEWGFFQFLRFAIAQPPAQFVVALSTYARMSIDVLARKSWRSTVGRPKIRARHRRRLGKVAKQAGLPLSLVQRIDSLKETPIEDRFLGITMAFYLDRFLLLGLVLLGLVVSALLPIAIVWRVLIALCVVGLAIPTNEILKAIRTRESTPHLGERALIIARLLDVPFASFGHSHMAQIRSHQPANPKRKPLHHYLNTGHWVIRDAATAMTYVEVTCLDNQPEARLMRWMGEGQPPEELGLAKPGQRDAEPEEQARSQGQNGTNGGGRDPEKDPKDT